MAVGVGNAKEEDLICCANYLIKFGANVNAVDTYGNSPLIYAAKTGKAGLTEVLIENGADINHPNNDGWNVTTLSLYLQFIDLFDSKGTPLGRKGGLWKGCAKVIEEWH